MLKLINADGPDETRCRYYGLKPNNAKIEIDRRHTLKYTHERLASTMKNRECHPDNTTHNESAISIVLNGE